jgi:hypothetical protein
MLVSVTAKDIAAGLRADCGECPIALAMRRATGMTENRFTAAYVAVTGDRATLCRGKRKPHEDWRLPQEAVSFQRAFDAGRPVEPFEFEALYLGADLD